jgi:hypothetical protein
MKEFVLFTALALVPLCTSLAVAQDKAEPAIEDNSFFIEEAYNQEAGVVQHINTFAAAGRDHRDLFYSFTQEWPFRSQRNQLSYTVPVSRLDGQSAGFGDVLLNYRLQLGAGERRWALAPRLSLILPTGSVDRGLGDGSPGLQVNLPLSYHLTGEIVTHLNAGGTVLPWAKGPSVGGPHPKRTLTSVFAGGSLIGPVTFPVQLMLETVVSSDGAISPTGAVDHTTSWIMSPGVRAALNFGSLQVVPGFAVPFTRSQGETVHDYFIYLSFEHPFSSAAK